MKSKFSTSWKSSKQPRKQRKYRYNLPLHSRKKLLSTTLSKELKQKYKKRNVTVKKGDKVKILRGNFKGKTGEISNVDRKKAKVNIIGVDQLKRDGSKTPIPIDPSNIMIIELKIEDKHRTKSLQRK